MSAQHELDDGPSDAISSLRFSASGSKLLVSSWDCSVSLYTRTEGEKPFTFAKRIQCRAPILEVCWGADEDIAYAVGLDQDVRRLDFSNNDEAEQVVLSTHEKASNKVAYSKEHGILLSTSWDGILHVHNTAVAQGKSFIKIALGAKPFALSLTEERAVIAMAERKVSVYDLRALRSLTEQTSSASIEEGSDVLHVAPWQQRESSLKFMTRAVATMPDGTGFAASSIEGRVSVEWFDPEQQSNTYAFKCHRQPTQQTGEDGTQKDIDVVYPVNALSFNPIHGTFATGGGDGVVALWDAQTKRRIRQYPRQPASVAALDFSADGKFIAIGISPGLEDGREEDEIDGSLVKVVVKELSENEAKAKAAK